MEGVGGFRLQTFPQRAEAQSSPAGCLCCSCINNTIMLVLYHIVYYVGISLYCISYWYCNILYYIGIVSYYTVYYIGIVLVYVV